MNERSTPDVVVIGGGIAGLGVAWRLAQGGLGVTVVDPAPGSGASDVAAGMIAPVSEATFTEPALLALGVESARRWPGFAEELETASGRSVGYRRHGTLVLACDADDLRAIDVLHDYQREQGLAVERLTSQECRRLEPGLSPRVRGGVLVPDDHQVDNRAVTAALLAAAEAAGVAFHHHPVTTLETAGDRVVGVTTPGGTLHAGTVVLAAGAWSARIPGLPPEAVPPIRPVKGQILRLRTSPGDGPLLSHSIRGLVDGRPVYFVPRADGEVVVGGTVEERGYDTTVTVEGVREIVTAAFALVPGVDDLELAEARAGLRPGTPDNAPILGLSAVEGLVMATGHYRHGFLLLPVTADAVAATVLDGAAPAEIESFTPLRFATREVVA